MITLKARFDGRVFVPEEPVDLPAGCTLEIGFMPPTASADKPLVKLAALLDEFPSDPDWPADFATQHDHYLYGTPKRPCP